MGRSSVNRTNNSLLNLALAAFYLNLTLQTANGSQYYSMGPMFPVPLPPVSAPAPWPEVLTTFAQQGFQNFDDNNKAGTGFKNTNGYYDDLLSQRNAYDYGKAYGDGYDYGKGSIVGGGYRDLNGRNKGHQASGFSTSYRKDESGDKKTYYDDGLGHNAKIDYAAHDARFRDLGGLARRGGYHDTNMNRNAIGNSGRYGDQYGYRGYTGSSTSLGAGNGYGFNKGDGYGFNKGNGYGFNKGGGYGFTKGDGLGYSKGTGYLGYGKGGYGGYGDFKGGYHRHGRLVPPSATMSSVDPSMGNQFQIDSPGSLKNTGVYVIPMPDKLFFDQTSVAPVF